MGERLEKFEKYVRYYARRLGVDKEWIIHISEEKVDPAGLVTTMPELRQAWIRLSDEESLDVPYCKGDVCIFPMALEIIAAHEVCHILHNSVRDMITALIEALPETRTSQQLGCIAKEEDEKFVHRLAEIVVKVFPIEE